MWKFKWRHRRQKPSTVTSCDPFFRFMFRSSILDHHPPVSLPSPNLVDSDVLNLCHMVLGNTERAEGIKLAAVALQIRVSIVDGRTSVNVGPGDSLPRRVQEPNFYLIRIFPPF